MSQNNSLSTYQYNKYLSTFFVKLESSIYCSADRNSKFKAHRSQALPTTALSAFFLLLSTPET